METGGGLDDFIVTFLDERFTFADKATWEKHV